VQHRRPNPETEVLSEPAAARLLERASQLDAARIGSTAVADLRAAATAAGISSGAFDAALEEMQQPAPPAVPELPAPQPRPRRWKLVASFVAVIVALGFVGIRRSVAPAGRELAREAFMLRCLSTGEAAALIRPILGENGQAYSRPDAPRVLNVSGTPAQIERVRAELDRRESPGSAACAVRPGPATTR
jgi:hypothetical protein